MADVDLIEARKNILSSTETRFEFLPYKVRLDLMRKFAKSSWFPIFLPDIPYEYLSNDYTRNDYEEKNKQRRLKIRSLVSDGFIQGIDELESHSVDHQFDCELRLKSLLESYGRPFWTIIDSIIWWYKDRLGNQMLDGVLALAIERAHKECDRHLPVELTHRILKQAFGF